MTVFPLRPARSFAALLCVAVAAGGAGCGRATSADNPTAVKPKVGVRGNVDAAADLGFPTFATKNTTRLAGSDPVADAAAVTQIVYPSTTPATRPQAVTFVDAGDWRTALAASVLNAPPLNAPILYTRGTAIPAATTTALNELQPSGSKAAAAAQVIRVGTLAKPGALRTTDIRGKDPIALARGIDAFATAARGKPSPRVMLVTADDPAFAAPAAAWAATSGDPVLFTHKDSVPAATIAAIKTHKKPKIYVLGPSTVITPKVTKQLKGLGKVIRLGGQNPITNAIEFAAFADGDFGWGAANPGHGLVVIPRGADPATAAAVAPLSASGTYGPSLLLSSPTGLDAQLGAYLKDIQPAFQTNAARGFYNHAWLVGDTKAISTALQGEIDRSLETVPLDTGTAK
ncbi:MAG: hypothetical protein JWM31_846 [Solirubrobacterales bacterium]|nr:hypothetical protein [Solirubrobacterales bacterium]